MIWTHARMMFWPNENRRQGYYPDHRDNPQVAREANARLRTTEVNVLYFGTRMSLTNGHAHFGSRAGQLARRREKNRQASRTDLPSKCFAWKPPKAAYRRLSGCGRFQGA